MEKLINTIVGAIQDKKGKNIVSLDLTGFDGAICSHFVICNADSTTQVAAIADGIEEKVFEQLHEKVHRIEGMNNGLRSITSTWWCTSSSRNCAISTAWSSCGQTLPAPSIPMRSNQIRNIKGELWLKNRIEKIDNSSSVPPRLWVCSGAAC